MSIGEKLPSLILMIQFSITMWHLSPMKLDALRQNVIMVTLSVMRTLMIGESNKLSLVMKINSLINSLFSGYKPMGQMIMIFVCHQKSMMCGQISLKWHAISLIQ